MAYAEAFEGDGPSDELANVGLVGPGVGNILAFDLTPGTYVAIDWFPDRVTGGDGSWHNEGGMPQRFIVIRD